MVIPKSIADIVAIIIALASLVISMGVAFGDANINVKYVLGDQGKFYLYKTNENLTQDLDVQFIVQNRGYGSTIYTVDAITCMNPPHCLSENYSSLPMIRYNNERDYRKIQGPDFQAIQPKSSDLVEIIFPNVDSGALPDYIEIRVQDYISSKELWLKFKKSPISHDFILEVFNS